MVIGTVLIENYRWSKFPSNAETCHWSREITTYLLQLIWRLKRGNMVKVTTAKDSSPVFRAVIVFDWNVCFITGWHEVGGARSGRCCESRTGLAYLNFDPLAQTGGGSYQGFDGTGKWGCLLDSIVNGCSGLDQNVFVNITYIFVILFNIARI